MHSLEASLQVHLMHREERLYQKVGITRNWLVITWISLSSFNSSSPSTKPGPDESSNTKGPFLSDFGLYYLCKLGHCTPSHCCQLQSNWTCNLKSSQAHRCLFKSMNVNFKVQHTCQLLHVIFSKFSSQKEPQCVDAQNSVWCTVGTQVFIWRVNHLFSFILS